MKFGSMLCIALFAASMPVAAQETGTLKKLRDTGEIVLGVRDASIPFSYADDSGKSIGYSVDLCMRVVDRLRQTNAPRPCVALGFGPGLHAEATLFQ